MQSFNEHADLLTNIYIFWLIKSPNREIPPTCRGEFHGLPIQTGVTKNFDPG